MTQPVQSMTNRTLAGLFWMSLSTGVNFLSLLLVLVALARLLTPADFGLAAAAIMVTGVLAVFAELGIGPAVVQRMDLQASHVRSAFALAFGLGILFFGMSWVAAPAISELFGVDELTPIIRFLSLIFPVQGLGVVAESLLQRELRFRCLAGIETVVSIFGYAGVGITLGLLDFGVWALIGAHLAQACMRTVLFLACRPHPVQPFLQRRACAELLGFGGGFTAGRFSNYLAGQGENFVLGYCLGPTALGVYGRAYQLMAAPAVLFGNVLDRVLFPAMVRVQDQPKRLADAYRRGSALIAVVILPISVVLIALAPEVTHVVLGSEWDAVIVPLQILGVGMLFRTSCKIGDSLVRATGAVYRRTWRQTIYALLVLGGAWIGQHWGVEGVAVAVLGTLAANFFFMAHLSLCLADMSWRTFILAHVPGMALAAAVGLPVVATAHALRALDLAPMTVLAVSMTAMLPSLLAVALLPKIFLGEDGRWMARKLLTLLFQSGQGKTQGEGLAGSSDFMAAANPDHLAARLVARLEVEGVRYGCWKSQMDVPRFLSGAGDLDLLVAPSGVETFLNLVQDLGFRQTVNSFEKASPQEIHLHGLDHESGVLLHLHVNFSLGQKTFDEMVLANCTTLDGPGVLQGMPVVQPRADVIIFVVRTMARYALWREGPRLVAQAQSLHRKLGILLEADAKQGWQAVLQHWLPAVPPELFGECLKSIEKPTSWMRRFLLAKKLQKVVGNGAFAQQKANCGSLLQAAWKRMIHGRGSPKQLPTGGIVIAIIGPDASGKSTVVSEATRWLEDVFRVHTAHLGKPPSTWLTWLPNRLGRLLGKLAPNLRTFHQAARHEEKKSGKRSLLYRLRAVLLAWDRRALARRLASKAAQGWMVVCDRYPTAVVGGPDSARLQLPEDTNETSLLHTVPARLENRFYRAIPLPDVVIRLSAPLGIALGRNRDRIKAGKEGDDFVAQRHSDFFVPRFEGRQVLELDTNTPLPETILMLRKLLWTWLCSSARQPSLVTDDLPNQRFQDTVREDIGELQKS